MTTLQDILAAGNGTPSAEPGESNLGDGSTGNANDSMTMQQYTVPDSVYSELDADVDPEPIPNREPEGDEQTQEPKQNPEGDAQPQEPTQEPEGEPQQVTNEAYAELQASYTKSRQELAALKAKTAALEKHLASASFQLPPEVEQELEQLKYTDPEAWRQRLNAIENKRAKDLDAEISKQVEVERRTQLLAEYNAANPDHKIDDYVAENVLPRGMVSKLERGEVSFESFLKEASNFLKNIVKHGPGNSANAGKQAPITKVGGGVQAQTTNMADVPDDDDTVW